MTASPRHPNPFAQRGSTERTTFFSDAVFAIAMTLLIIELHVPEVPEALLGPALRELLPGYLTFVLSFVVVGAIWMSHHRKFSVIERADQGLLRLNLLMLLFVASLPLPTAILGRYGDVALAAVIYAVNIAAIGFLLTGMWVYAWRRGLVASAVDLDAFRLMLVKSFPIPGVFLLSIPVALLAGATAAELSWIAALPASMLLARLYRARAQAAAH